jgi:hypothetical protein
MRPMHAVAPPPAAVCYKIVCGTTGSSMTEWFSWRVLGPGVAFAAALAAAGERMRPPASGVADRCITIAAVLLGVKLVAWVARRGHAFAREERLLTFVMFITIVLSWIGLRQTIGEAAFNYAVAAQRADLAMAARTLSFQLDVFLQARRRIAPPAPKPATWEADEAFLERFETETVVLYERRFGRQVRNTHDLLTFRGLRTRDLDQFYRRPANEFQMHVIAKQLAFLAMKLDENKLAD